MNDLDLFRSARPAVAPLDEAIADEIRRAVFGGVEQRRPSSTRMRRSMGVVACAAAAVAVVVAVPALRRDDSRSIRPATTASTAAATGSTVATSTSTPSTVPFEEDWHVRPQLRFQPTAEYTQLYTAALDAAIGRCMAALGFDYHGNPYQSDSEVPATREPGSYEAAFMGQDDSGGGCQDQAVHSIFGAVRGDVYASRIEGNSGGAWTRSALIDPSLRAALAELVACARAHGVNVRDAPERLNKVYDDVVLGLEGVIVVDERMKAVERSNPQDLDANRAVYHELADELCPTYSSFEEDLAAAERLAEVAWIEGNPETMAAIQAEFDDDISRFRYIVDHAGELPPG